jgi:hypothetical protein
MKKFGLWFIIGLLLGLPLAWQINQVQALQDWPVFKGAIWLVVPFICGWFTFVFSIAISFIGGMFGLFDKAPKKTRSTGRSLFRDKD